MNWHFLDEKAFLPRVPGPSQKKGQEQRGHVSCRRTGFGFGISSELWGGCLDWCGKFGARTWGIKTEVVGAALMLWLSGAAGERSPVVQGSREGELR